MINNRYQYYQRKINFYETDKMGVVHHSNYTRILEECRMDMLEFYTIPYTMFEEYGIMDIRILSPRSKIIEKYNDKLVKSLM